MKSKYLILASAVLISVGGFAQKDQIKAADKAQKAGNPMEAINQLKLAEGSIANASPSEKAQYYFIKGNASLDMADKKMEVGKNNLAAAKAYQDVIELEKTSGKAKYSDEAKTKLATVKNNLLNAAQAEGAKKNYKGAADLLYASYELDTANLENLYYAASYYLNGQDYDNALKYFQQLKAANYSGEGTNYFAKNAINDQEQYYGNDLESKKNRDSQVKLKLASDPRDEKVPSKKGDIAKYIALIYVQQGKNEDAKAALADAKAANPDDVSILSAEADVYLKMGDAETYRKLTKIIVEKDPKNPDLFFNLGVTSSKVDAVAAEGYYKKALELKPDYWQASLNLALLKMGDEQKLVDEMNKLGISEKDNKRYEVLKKQRDDMFRSAMPYLEKAYEVKPDEDVANTLLNVYGALEMTDKKKALKVKMAK